MKGVQEIRILKLLLVATLVGQWFVLGDDAQQDNRLRRTHHNGARLRHSRHLTTGAATIHGPLTLRSERSRTSNNDGVGDNKLIVQDNHKPVFTECSKYQPTVEEEKDPGTFVFQVKAMDKDPLESGGTITYTFVSAPGERLKFSIDPHTGQVLTKQQFDRDEPNREKEVYLAVRATDNGRPQLDDVCTIKVTIIDVNDNRPIFDKVNYQESVPQDLKVGREVMRISATDIDDGNNSIVAYELVSVNGERDNYFRIDPNTGVIFLAKAIDKAPNYKFVMRAKATDHGDPPLDSIIGLEIIVVESHKKAPTFESEPIPASPISLEENFNNFSTPLYTIKARSNIPDEKELLYELLTGRTEQTNKQNTFVLESDGETAYIKLGKHLDYESISEYVLTVRVQNKYNLAAQESVGIRVTDVNDNIPAFTEVTFGSVLENEPIGTPVMQVRAIDADGTSAHNQVSYVLADHKDLFSIDERTGNITTRVQFDREEKDVYNVKVIAFDNSPSALIKDGHPNKGEQTFRIDIADKNDNRPVFTKELYVSEALAEDANINFPVAEVKALDKDTASPVTYSIMGGNTGNAFLIENTTGKIRVNNKLDYENITHYVLRVRAFDGNYQDFANVSIEIANVNDNPPVFLAYNSNVTIKEEELVDSCITKLSAYDPDVTNRSAPQHIVYFVVKQEQKKLLHIDSDGCLKLTKPLDRDPPNGFEVWQVLIAADDEDGSPTSNRATTEVLITLIDINDNAPTLSNTQPVIWQENQPPGNITALVATDNDDITKNGPPFVFMIDENADEEINEKFSISGSTLYARVTFDREEKKMYSIPIAITDAGEPTMTGTSTLIVVIGDVNDNHMKPGQSSIFVYNYKGEAPDTEIGRVYVEDPDDWDIGDKTFDWTGDPHPNFDLNKDTGMIKMWRGTNNNSFLLKFVVNEESALISKHSVVAVVNVTVKEIPEEAVDKSGSIRFAGITAEEFVAPGPNGKPSKQNLLRMRLATILNASVDNVDVFTVLHSPHNINISQLDVRFSAHGSPYYFPERLNGMTAKHQKEIEEELGIKVLMVNIDECLMEKVFCETSCTNFLNKSSTPFAVYTNTSSFVGVKAVVDPLCTCVIKESLVCANGGTPLGDRCECAEGYEGPRCELIAIGFPGNGWALYPPLPACDDAHLSLDLTPYRDDGLVFYVGPIVKNPSLDVQDFMSLELHEGYPKLLADYGSGTVILDKKQIKLSDGKSHHIDIFWTRTSIEMKVDNCQMSSCLSLTAPQRPNEFLNVNGPLQLGGSFIDLLDLGKEMSWEFKPTDVGFSGCIRNLTFNGKTYNLGMPSDAMNVDVGCNQGIAKAVSFGIDTNFIVAILVCIAILLILLLAVVVHRRKTDDMYKDTDDIRENIINYEDEGGGEGDMTGYDLNVLRLMYDGQPNLDKQPTKENLQKKGPDEVPDICGFLDGKKKVCDNDPETNPFDDVRHYAYEGDGNTSGSLSSLASGTDEGDLNFDYLSNFGPRFRKLADMYGEDPSDEEEETFHNPASESWC